jgi:hypothetical protein
MPPTSRALASTQALAVIRKRCVHVLDREPEPDEVRRLIDGVERILRRYPERRDASD